METCTSGAQISCLPSRFQSNTEMYSSSIHFRVLLNLRILYTAVYIFQFRFHIGTRGLMPVVRSLLKLYAILVSNSVSKVHYIIQRRMRFCSPWGYKVVSNSVSKAYYTIQSRRYLAYFSMLNLALDLSCGLTSRRTCSAHTCPNSAVSKAMVNPSIIHDVSLITI